MRVAVDARRLQDRPPTGVGRMLANLLPLLTPAVKVVLLTDARRDPAPGPWEQHALRVPRGAPEPIWLQAKVARWLRRFDGVFHGAFNALPRGTSVPAVVTFYDLSWLQHHEDFRPDKLIVWRAQARYAARTARAVTTISHFVRDGIVDAYGIDPRRIFITPPAVDPVFSPERAEEAGPLLERFGIAAPYVVALGGARRRGLPVAVAAWRMVRRGGGDWSLVVVGKEAPPREPGIVHVGQLDDGSWSALLAAATAFCYPTRYEGFGMPALEAIASGTPVVCARVGPLGEVLGRAAEWCEEPSVEAIAAGLVHVLCDPAYRASLVSAGLARASSLPTWSDSAASLVEAYSMAAGGSPP